jgi:Type III flagellar switch regulator (C-ring) FliN C-term
MATQSPSQSISSQAPALGRAAAPEPSAIGPGTSPASLVAGLHVRGTEPGLNDEGGASLSAGILRLSLPMERLPVGLAVSVPVREFRIRNLLAMAAGELIETQWGHGDDLPLSSGGVQLAWSEFEVVDTRLAVRVTRLA